MGAGILRQLQWVPWQGHCVMSPMVVGGPGAHPAPWEDPGTSGLCLGRTLERGRVLPRAVRQDLSGAGLQLGGRCVCALFIKSAVF